MRRRSWAEWGDLAVLLLVFGSIAKAIWETITVALGGRLPGW